MSLINSNFSSTIRTALSVGSARSQVVPVHLSATSTDAPSNNNKGLSAGSTQQCSTPTSHAVRPIRSAGSTDPTSSEELPASSQSVANIPATEEGIYL